MIISSRKAAMLVVATAVAAGGLSLSDRDWSVGGPVSKAEARVGRPLTPMSYAGVARRTTRRAVAVGAAGAAGRLTVLTPHQAACRSWMPMAGSSRSAIELLRLGIEADVARDHAGHAAFFFACSVAAAITLVSRR